jgi:hypothetical protein
MTNESTILRVLCSSAPLRQKRRFSAARFAAERQRGRGCRVFVALISSFVIPAAASIHSSGLRATSADYTADFSSTPGLAHSSADYTARTGHSGQLYDATALDVQATPLTLHEASTRQLGADLLFDDDTRELLPATSITWSIQSGPLASISINGLATAAAVYQNTAAIVHAAHFGVTGTLTLTVLETIPDNFGLYASDRLPDTWQVQFLGPDNPLGGPAANPDGDGSTNLLEFAFGTDPLSSSTATLAHAAGLITLRGQPAISVQNIPNSVDFRAVFLRRKDYLGAGLRYRVQFSGDLLTWATSSATPTLLASDAEMDAVSVPYPFFVNGKKARFFRVSVDFIP